MRHGNLIGLVAVVVAMLSFQPGSAFGQDVPGATSQPAAATSAPDPEQVKAVDAAKTAVIKAAEHLQTVALAKNEVSYLTNLKPAWFLERPPAVTPTPTPGRFKVEFRAMTDDPVGIAWARLLVDSKGICYYTRFYFTPVASPPFFPPGTR